MVVYWAISMVLAQLLVSLVSWLRKSLHLTYVNVNASAFLLNMLLMSCFMCMGYSQAPVTPPVVDEAAAAAAADAAKHEEL